MLRNKMDLLQFKKSLKNKRPKGLTKLLEALWYDGSGNWKKAHEITQEIHSENAAEVHAYLHRKEGDKWNANYWYERARKPFCDASLNQEWQALVKKLLVN